MGAGTLGYLTVILLAPGATWALLLPLLDCGLGMGAEIWLRAAGTAVPAADGDCLPEAHGMPDALS